MISFVLLILALTELTVQVQAMQCMEGLDTNVHSYQMTRTAVSVDDISPQFYLGDTIRSKRKSKRKSSNINDIKDTRINTFNAKATSRKPLEEVGYSNTTVVDYADVADRQIREDHVTQLLQEMTVNTDSEITGLQASRSEESEDDSEQSAGAGELSYFAFDT